MKTRSPALQQLGGMLQMSRGEIRGQGTGHWQAPCSSPLQREQQQGLPWQRARGHPVGTAPAGPPQENATPLQSVQAASAGAALARGKTLLPRPSASGGASRPARPPAPPQTRWQLKRRVSSPSRTSATGPTPSCRTRGSRWHLGSACTVIMSSASPHSVFPSLAWGQEHPPGRCLAAGLAVAAACHQTKGAQHQVHSSRGDLQVWAPDSP